MAGIQASGLGSGLDINSLVSQLVAAERAPLEQRITRHEMAVTADLSALGTLKSALSTFKSALEPLRNLDVFRVRTASSADQDIFTATAGATAQPGSYDIEVRDIAKAHQVRSNPFPAGSTAVVGTGTLTLTLGSASTNVTINNSNNTLAGIASAINSSTNNPGIRATIVSGVDGSHLVLTSTKTGAANTIQVTQSGGDGNLSQIATGTLTQLAPAQDAEIWVQGIRHTNASNVITTAIEGVTLTLKAEDEGTPVALNVGYDATAATARINQFVTAFNSLHAQIAKLRSYDANTKAAGPMLGDPLLSGVEGQVRRGLSDAIQGLTGPYQSLVSIGIKATVTGTLELDATKLKAALESDFDGVGAVFASTNGVAARLFTQIEQRLASAGEIESRSSGLNKSMTSISKDKEALELRMAQVEARYRAQFTALDSLLAQMQSTSNYLAQQLASLPGAGS